MPNRRKRSRSRRLQPNRRLVVTSIRNEDLDPKQLARIIMHLGEQMAATSARPSPSDASD